VSHDNSLAYEALSYVWGDPKDHFRIRLNGKDHILTFNLFTALNQLQHPHEERLLWVDALCINQASNSERSQQVALMADIYKSASLCRVWLGEADADAEPVEQSLEFYDDTRDDEIIAEFVSQYCSFTLGQDPSSFKAG
jgi:hypothetical protein